MLQHQVIIYVITLLLFAIPAFSQQGPVNNIEGASPGFDTASPERNSFNVGDWGIAEQRGAATYTYPIQLPPGRRGMRKTRNCNMLENDRPFKLIDHGGPPS